MVFLSYSDFELIFLNFCQTIFKGFSKLHSMFPSEPLEEKNLSLKKIVIIFNFFGYCVNNFWAPCHKHFVRNVKTGFYASNGPFWSKKYLFENRSILETSSYLEQQDFIFLLENFRRGCQSCTSCFCWNIARKTKTSSEKFFFYIFWTSVEEFSVFHRKKTVRLSTMQCTCP